MATLLIITVVGLLTGLAIAIVSKLFAAPADPLQDQIVALLPGANCGGCGFAGCAGYAEALASGRAKPGLCNVQPPEAMARLAKLLGVAVEEKAPQVAVVLCGGDKCKATRQAQYNGINDCRDAAQVDGGAKTCNYGCLGLGSCARACPFGAIEILPTHVAKIHPNLCKGCGKCVSVCPRRVIKLVPRAAATVNVYCNSPEKAPVKKKVCSGGCIGCRKCMKAAGENQILINGFLASVNYENPPAESVTEVCPMKCLRKAE